MTLSSPVTCSSALCLSHPHRWLPKTMSSPGTVPPLKSLSQAPPLYPQPQASQPTLSPLWDMGSGLSRTLDLASSSAAPSVFILLPPQLRFPGPSLKHCLPTSAALLAAHLMVPPSWQLPSPGGSPATSSLEAPSPTSTAGSKAGEASVGWIFSAARHARSPVQLALACPYRAGHLFSLLSTIELPTEGGKTASAS